MATVTLGLLAELGACGSQRREFENLFGNESVEVTPELCEKHAETFDWDWAARNMLTREQFREYIRRYGDARREYEKEWERIHDEGLCSSGACAKLSEEWSKKSARYFGEMFTGEQTREDDRCRCSSCMTLTRLSE